MERPQSASPRSNPNAVEILANGHDVAPTNGKGHGSFTEEGHMAIRVENMIHNEVVVDTNLTDEVANGSQKVGSTNNVWFSEKRPLANTVRTGQPGTGPYIFGVDEKEKAVGSIVDEEGNLIVEFADDDNKVLAGHFGHAVVGKFSHSLPTRHQVQQLLGKINLVGAYTLTYLNAKHIMMEYVKVMSGPNGSPT